MYRMGAEGRGVSSGVGAGAAPRPVVTGGRRRLPGQPASSACHDRRGSPRAGGGRRRGVERRIAAVFVARDGGGVRIPTASPFKARPEPEFYDVRRGRTLPINPASAQKPGDESETVLNAIDPPMKRLAGFTRGLYPCPCPSVHQGINTRDAFCQFCEPLRLISTPHDNINHSYEGARVLSTFGGETA